MHATAASEFVSAELGRCHVHPCQRARPCLEGRTSAPCMHLLGSACTLLVCWPSLFSALVVTPQERPPTLALARVELHGVGKSGFLTEDFRERSLWLPCLCLLQGVLAHREQQPQAGEPRASCRERCSGVRASYSQNGNLSLQPWLLMHYRPPSSFGSPGQPSAAAPAGRGLARPLLGDSRAVPIPAAPGNGPLTKLEISLLAWRLRDRSDVGLFSG